MSEPATLSPAASRRPSGIAYGDRLPTRAFGNVAGALAAELIGTYLLVFLGVGTVLATKLVLAPEAPLDATLIALAFGFAVVVAVYALGHVSGAHINPSVTVGLATIREVPPLENRAVVTSRHNSAALCSHPSHTGHSSVTAHETNCSWARQRRAHAERQSRSSPR